MSAGTERFHPASVQGSPHITESQVDDLLAILDEGITAVERSLPPELRG